eukprot:146648-Chlamydomonas_euryale.AAC.3
MCCEDCPECRGAGQAAAAASADVDDARSGGGADGADVCTRGDESADTSCDDVEIGGRSGGIGRRFFVSLNSGDDDSQPPSLAQAPLADLPHSQEHAWHGCEGDGGNGSGDGQPQSLGQALHSQGDARASGEACDGAAEPTLLELNGFTGDVVNGRLGGVGRGGDGGGGSARGAAPEYFSVLPALLADVFPVMCDATAAVGGTGKFWEASDASKEDAACLAGREAFMQALSAERGRGELASDSYRDQSHTLDPSVPPPDPLILLLRSHPLPDPTYSFPF